MTATQRTHASKNHTSGVDSSGTTSGLLKTGLLANAALSIGTGLLMTIAGPTVSGWLGLNIGGWLRLLGIALVGHAGMLVWASRQDNMGSWGKLNLAAIGGYPFLLVGLVVFGVIEKNLGIGLTLLDASAVGLLAIMQFVGLRSHR